MKLNGAQITIKLLEQQGIKTIAGIPGGSNLPLYDALYESNIQHILARHEQGAAFIAQGITRSTGDVAVCFATSGPGATNLLTAIADAKLDSIPIIAITGQVPYSAIGTDSFQEVDTYGLTIPITKHNFLVRSVEDLFTIIPEAFRLSKEGRPGPVVIDIPKNIQTEVLDFDSFPKLKTEIVTHHIDKEDLIKAVNLIQSSKKPILYIGGGIINSNSHSEIYSLAKKNSIPAVTTLMGLGCFPCDDTLYLGMLGMHGARYTNLLLNEADLIIALGVRFDDRAVGNISKFCPNAKIIHVDIDESEINKLRSADLFMVGDINSFIVALTEIIEYDSREEWINTIKDFKLKFPLILPKKDDLFHPVNIIRTISSIADKDAIISTDVGQHQMWVAQTYSFNTPKALLTSGGLGTMGFGLPAAIGAALANKDRQVICFSGDGSFLMNIQELATLKDLNLNIKIIILNNGRLGLVKQQQQLFYDEHYIASKFISNPDFSIIAKGFGIDSCNLDKETSPIDKLYEILSKEGPYLINIPIDPTANVYPMVPPGESIDKMVGGEDHER